MQLAAHIEQGTFAPKRPRISGVAKVVVTKLKVTLMTCVTLPSTELFLRILSFVNAVNIIPFSKV